MRSFSRVTPSVLLLATCLLALAATPAGAQDNPSLAISFFECDWPEAIQWMEETDSLAIPIYQELVDEGKLLGFGTLIHDFAGYENVILWRSAPSVEANIAAQQAFGQRFSERHPNFDGANCLDHRDAFYRLGPSTGPTPDSMNTMVVSYHKCDFDQMGAVIARHDSLALPIANELVAEGKLGGFGLLVHDWATRENIITFYSAKNRSAFFEGWAEFNKRMGERHPGANLLEGCGAHSDGLYWIGPRTKPPQTTSMQE